VYHVIRFSADAGGRCAAGAVLAPVEKAARAKRQFEKYWEQSGTE
jgi:hypothetical protein